MFLHASERRKLENQLRWILAGSTRRVQQVIVRADGTVRIDCARRKHPVIVSHEAALELVEDYVLRLFDLEGVGGL